MLTKSQKVASYIFGILALIIGIVAAVPFRTFGGSADLLTVENIVKFIAFPIVILLLITYFNVIRYKQLKEGVERSRTVNVLSYLPLCVYAAGILAFTLHTLTFKQHPMSDVSHGLLVLISVAYLVVVVCALPLVEKYVMKLTKKGSLIVDGVAVFLMIVFALISYRVAKTYISSYATADNGFLYSASNYDPYLFCLYVVLFFVAVFYISKLIKLVKADETVVYVVKLTDEEVDQLILEEYDNAYNDILDEFEDYFDKQLEAEAAEEEEAVEEEPVEEESKEENPEEESEEAVAAVLPAEEQPEEEAPAEEPAEEEVPAEEQPEEEAPAEEPAEEEAPAEEQPEEEAPAEEPAEEEAPAEEPVEEEAPAEEQPEEEAPAEEQPEEAPAEEPAEEAPAEEPAEEEAPVEEPVEEEAPVEEQPQEEAPVEEPAEEEAPVEEPAEEEAPTEEQPEEEKKEGGAE